MSQNDLRIMLSDIISSGLSAVAISNVTGISKIDLSSVIQAATSNTSVIGNMPKEAKANNIAYMSKVHNTIEKQMVEINRLANANGWSDVKVTGVEEASGKIQKLTLTVRDAEVDDYIKSLGAKQVISDRGSYFELNGALEEVYEKMQSIQEVANQLGEDKYANRLSDQINDAQELTNKYKDMYDAYVLYEQVLKDTDYSSAYQKAMSDYQNYQKQ